MLALLDFRMHDGSRHFGDLPQHVSWYAVRDHVHLLPGARLTDFLCDGVTEAWIDFTYEGHAVTLHDPMGDYSFFVADPTCPEATLRTVLDHFERLTR